MMKLYIFQSGTFLVLAVIHGETGDECISKAEANGFSMSSLSIGSTYQPHFGEVGGLVENVECKEFL